MAKLSGFKEYNKAIQKQVIATIHSNEMIEMIDDYFESTLMSNKKADGRPQPKKALSTKKHYKRHGYDTENWLVRTGKSAKRVYKKITNGISIGVRDKKVLGYHQDDAEDWFQLNKTISTSIKDLITKRLTEAKL